MEFREIIAVTGIAGLKRVVANRNDGLILSELDGSNKKFYSNRQHMFSLDGSNKKFYSNRL
jgi:hypothetical protein